MQAFIFIAIVKVEMTTLTALIAASVAGAWLGAGLVASWPRRRVQLGMGLALLAAASFFAMTNLNVFPAGGNALGLRSPLLWVGIAGNFMLGALMTLGIGLYAPCMILIALLGMNPQAAFPIMMGSCAFLMPVGGLRFIAQGQLQPQGRARPDDRRVSGRPARGVRHQVTAAGVLALADRRGRALHGHRDAAVGGRGEGVLPGLIRSPEGVFPSEIGRRRHILRG